MLRLVIDILVVLVLGLPLHFYLNRKEREAFHAACEREQVANEKCARMAKALRNIKAMLHCSRGRRSNEFGGPVALPIAAESMGQQSAKTPNLNGRR